MNEEKNDLERPFVVDGIKEYDNPLPGWWLGLFWFTILFGVGYLIYLHGMSGTTLDEELATDREAYEEQFAASQNLPAGGADLEQMAGSADVLEQGKQIYVQNCAACRGQEGQGLVGPNLTDKYWIHGGSSEAILKVISEGVPAKGMIAWKSILGPQKIAQVAAYMTTLQGTTPPNPKAPQGELYEK